MHLKFRLFTLVLFAGWGLAVQAQLIGGVSVSPGNVKVGEAVSVTATLDVLGNNFCGFAVFFGDGKSNDGVSDDKKPSALAFTHTYEKPGTYTITLAGRHVDSHPNCGGPDKMTTVTVTESVHSQGGTAVPSPVVVGAANPPKASASAPCMAPWILTGKISAKTGAFLCTAHAGTPLPLEKTVCPGDLSYFENVRKGQYGCRI